MGAENKSKLLCLFPLVRVGSWSVLRSVTRSRIMISVTQGDRDGLERERQQVTVISHRRLLNILMVKF